MKKNWKLILALCALAGGSWLLFSGVPAEDIHRIIAGFGPWAPAAYMAAFAVLPAFFFPVAVLALAGGLLFGLWWGSVYTFLGAMVNCSVMFFLSRTIGREPVRALVESKLSRRWQQRLAAAGGRGGFGLLVVLRLIPAVPYNLINYGFGLTSMGYGTYLLGSAIGIIPGTLVFINIGDKAMELTSPGFWTAIGLLVLLLAVTAALGKKLFPDQASISENREIQ